ncbi:glutathione S-transferase family protein [Geminicoccus roseus]|uniref:glutathione S-transferase family protein n=1 Tax=Geminicoccus roseus TaxID=404900 RepID=UPI00041B3D52|nr:glutathione S-transferase family protein [Geminicoccus roseus]
MYELWIANKNYSSWSLRPWLLMRQLGIEFTERQVQFGAGSNWATFRAFSPNGQVPALRDGDLTVWESLGIVEYLAERHEGVWPGEARARAWARCAAAEMHAGFSTLRSRCPMSVGHRIRPAERPPELERDIARTDELWNEGIGRFGGPFLAGAVFSAVDAFFAPVVFRIQTYGLPLTGAAASYPALLLQLPGMQAWTEQALAEPWREPGHETDLQAAGTLLDDLRKG